MSNVGLSRGTRRFLLGFKIYILVISVILLGALVFLWVSLSRYQNKVDAPGSGTSIAMESVMAGSEESEKAAQKCFSDYLNGLTADDWIQIYYSTNPDRFDNESDVRNFIENNFINSDYKCYKKPGFTIAEPQYLIARDDLALAEFKLSGGGENFRVSESFIDIKGTEEYSVVAPVSSQVLINGQVVDADKYSDNMPVSASVSDYDEELINPVLFLNYNIDSLLAMPSDISVTGMTGNPCMPAVDGQYYEMSDSSSSAEYVGKAEKFIEALLGYYSKGKENAEGNMHSVMSHVVSGSSAYKVINESYSGIIWRPADYSIVYSLQSSPAYVIADNCVFVDVAYTVTQKSESSDAGDGVYRVFMLDRGQGYGIVQFAGVK